MTREPYVNWTFKHRQFWPDWTNNTDQWAESCAALEDTKLRLGAKASIAADLVQGLNSGGSMTVGLAPNGYTYLLKLTPKVVYKLNANLIRTSFGTISTSLAYPWGCSALGPDGCLYCAPYDHHQILKIDTTTDTLSYIGDFGTGTGKWRGATCRENGDIVFAPYNSTSFLVCDMAGNTNTYGALGGTEKKYYCCTHAPDGSVYASPGRNGNCAKLNPDNTVSTFGSFTPPYSYPSYGAAVLLPTNKILCVPGYLNPAKALVIDLTDDSYTTFSTIAGNYQYLWATLASDGLVYACSDHVFPRLIINPETQESWVIPPNTIYYSNAGVFHPNGCILIISSSAYDKRWGLQNMNLETNHVLSRYF